MQYSHTALKIVIHRKMLTQYQNLHLFISSPLEQFEVTSLLGLNVPVLGYFNLTLTNLALYSVLVILFIITLHYYCIIKIN